MSKPYLVPLAPRNGTWAKKGEAATAAHRWLDGYGNIMPVCVDEPWDFESDYPLEKDGAWFGYFLPGNNKAKTQSQTPVKNTMNKDQIPPAPENGTWLKKGEIVTPECKYRSYTGEIFAESEDVGQKTTFTSPEGIADIWGVSKYRGYFLPGNNKAETQPKTHTKNTMNKTTTPPAPENIPPAPQNGTWLKKGDIITAECKYKGLSGRIISSSLPVGETVLYDYTYYAREGGEPMGYFLPGKPKGAPKPSKCVKTQKKAFPAASGTVLNMGTKSLYIRLDGIPRKNLVGRKVVISL